LAQPTSITLHRAKHLLSSRQYSATSFRDLCSEFSILADEEGPWTWFFVLCQSVFARLLSDFPADVDSTETHLRQLFEAGAEALDAVETANDLLLVNSANQMAIAFRRLRAVA
jgi:hypothetical protein